MDEYTAQIGITPFTDAEGNVFFSDLDADKLYKLGLDFHHIRHKMRVTLRRFEGPLCGQELSLTPKDF